MSTSAFAKAYQMVLSLTIIYATVCPQHLDWYILLPSWFVRDKSLVASFIPSIGLIFLVAHLTHTLKWFECLLVSTRYKYKYKKNINHIVLHTIKKLLKIVKSTTIYSNILSISHFSVNIRLNFGEGILRFLYGF